MSRALLDHQDRAHPSDGGKVRFMVRSGGYVMCRRPRCAPYVMSEAEWRRLPAFNQEALDTYQAALRTTPAQTVETLGPAASFWANVDTKEGE